MRRKGPAQGGYRQPRPNCQTPSSNRQPFGFGRSWRDSSRHVQLGKINLSDAKKYIKKYDDEISEVDLIKTLDYLKISRIDFFQIIENHRNEEIWKKAGNKYSLVNPIK